ncbi:MAG: alpha/beta hydrolase [Rhodobacteraceae bacterium]|nr:alpha/beta hydrolase [Paracoccaceae bacterium]
MEQAPYFSDLDGANAPAESYWVRAADGVRIRVVLWRGGDAGTVVIYSGRTEYAEKSAPVAAEFLAAGFTVATLDWRGQGLSDRVAADPAMGHVRNFSDYQYDARAALETFEALGVPSPLFMIGHSMGGCIGVRSLLNKLPFAAAGFSGPMWGIKTSGVMTYLAPALLPIMDRMGMGLNYVPGSGPESFMLETSFEENTLTTDPDQLAHMKRQGAHDSRFALGGPSIHWTAGAFAEMKSLLQADRPTTPSLTYLGTLEEITDPDRIKAMHANWPSGRLEIVEGGKHELLMERADLRTPVIEGLIAHFRAHAGD